MQRQDWNLWMNPLGRANRVLGVCWLIYFKNFFLRLTWAPNGSAACLSKPGMDLSCLAPTCPIQITQQRAAIKE